VFVFVLHFYMVGGFGSIAWCVLGFGTTQPKTPTTPPSNLVVPQVFIFHFFKLFFQLRSVVFASLMAGSNSQQTFLKWLLAEFGILF
jgi:hypothetical protein